MYRPVKKTSQSSKSNLQKPILNPLFRKGLLVLKLSIRYLFCLSLLLFIIFGFSDTTLADITTIDVEVERTKSNNKSWDILDGAPDLGICLANETFGTVCFPHGSSARDIQEPNCPDSYRCKFSVNVPEDADFKISVVDVDVALNDPIGTGLCHTGMTCDIGQAKVTIK